jgi:hypothetical protein
MSAANRWKAGWLSNGWGSVPGVTIARWTKRAAPSCGVA